MQLARCVQRDSWLPLREDHVCVRFTKGARACKQKRRQAMYIFVAYDLIAGHSQQRRIPSGLWPAQRGATRTTLRARVGAPGLLLRSSRSVIVNTILWHGMGRVTWRAVRRDVA